eukprot:2074867-Pyramimonas_sp.AAC.1
MRRSQATCLVSPADTRGGATNDSYLRIRKRAGGAGRGITSRRGGREGGGRNRWMRRSVSLRLTFDHH